MAIYKCKMCGGDLEVEEGVTVVECDYCGTKQTVPTSHDEEIRNLFNRANLLRRKCEFDKAEELYEKILEKDEKQAEAYWCVLLCRYGIEYVEDPKTYKRIPTCHRTSFEAITSDEYYKLALKYSDPVQKKIYEEEAKYIDGVQKEILALSQKEEPYDVFICYKETDENGKRTEDSAIANDIYYQLTQEGYKVFYAAITLEDKLGSAYEPIIFAALHSSKVMLALGTKPEYFNAVWVKNEWSRFLKLMKNDKKKQLIPCYRGMDAYELPEEFAHLQAQDMGKIGFINDLVRGIKKVIPKEEPRKETPKETAATAGIKSLLQRMDLFLEDGDWAHAKEYAEKVLDIDPQNAEAYLGELLAEVKIANLYELYLHTKPIEDLPLFQKAYRFADKELKAKLDDAIEKNEKSIESKRVSDVYTMACAQEAIGKTETDFLAVGNLFESISGYKDSAERAKRCNEKAEMAREEVYQAACAKLESDDPKAVTSACELFRSIPEYRDADEKAIACDKKLAELDRLAAERAAAAKKRKKRALIIGSSVAAALIAVTVVSVLVVNRNETVAKAGLMYSLSSDGSYYTVSGVDETLEEYIIPETYHGKPVKEIAQRAFWWRSDIRNNVKSVTIGNNVTTIGKEAFQDCSNLTNLVIGSGVVTIGDDAFSRCDSLTSIVIPDSVTTIGMEAFYGCDSLTSIVIPDSVTTIGTYAFSSCDSLTNIAIPDSVTIINNGSFSGCSGLTSIVIPDSVTTIGDSAFSSCDSLTSIVIPNSVTTIGSYAFSGCSSLKNITIPNSVTLIESAAFEDCVGLQSITLPDRLIEIAYGTFTNCSGLTSIKIPDSVIKIGSEAFSGCNGLTSITFSGSLTEIAEIGAEAFADCAGLINVKIPDSVTTISSKAFYRCNGLTSVTIGIGVTLIGSEAFTGCKNLANAYFSDPDGWTYSYIGNTVAIAALSDPSNAARLLTHGQYDYSEGTGYSSYTWRKGE